MIKPKKILLVDDEPSNLQLLKQILGDKYRCIFATSGGAALAAAQMHCPDLILLDVMMPLMDGYEVCVQLKSKESTSRIPVVFITAMGEVEDESKGFDVGAVDYITKPVSPPIVLRRVQTHLSLIRVEELERSRLEIIRYLAKAAEYKDNDTGLHVVRMSLYCQLLARKAGMDEEWCTQLLNAAPMHDIGKMAVPDIILTKPDKLTAEEWEIIKTHPRLGAEMFSESDSELMQMAASVALSHHEKWNGEGYPNGVSGENIPIEGRIVAICDVFDALMAKRPYKEPWTLERVIELLQNEAGQHFDPALVAVFIDAMPEVLAIGESLQDDCPEPPV